MDIFDEAIIFAAKAHSGMHRKKSKTPYILHPLEVAQILSTLTDDEEVITAGILHDIVEESDGTLSEIEKRFGSRGSNSFKAQRHKNFGGGKRSRPPHAPKRNERRACPLLDGSRSAGHPKNSWPMERHSPPLAVLPSI